MKNKSTNKEIEREMDSNIFAFLNKSLNFSYDVEFVFYHVQYSYNIERKKRQKSAIEFMVRNHHLIKCKNKIIIKKTKGFVFKKIYISFSGKGERRLTEPTDIEKLVQQR